MSPLRVALADDHTLVREGLRSLLSSLAGVEVVGEASDGLQALSLVAEARPDVLLCDIAMPGLNGLDLAARVAREHPRTKVLILSMHADTGYVRTALLAGAAGYLLKNADGAELEAAIRAVGRGETWVSPGVSKAVVAALAQGGLPTNDPRSLLTPRQLEILQLIAEGSSTKQIAHKLGLSVKTIETHRSQLMDRLAIRDVAGLVRYALRVGIIRGEGG